jgi:hypothetical protein
MKDIALKMLEVQEVCFFVFFTLNLIFFLVFKNILFVARLEMLFVAVPGRICIFPTVRHSVAVRDSAGLEIFLLIYI